MTNRQSDLMCKRAAKEACKLNGMKTNMTDMVLLECSCGPVSGCTYVMFRDRKTGREWQCYYGVSYYTSEHPCLWYVREYVA